MTKNKYIEKRITSTRKFELDDRNIQIFEKDIFGNKAKIRVGLNALKAEPDTYIYNDYRFFFITSFFILNLSFLLFAMNSTVSNINNIYIFLFIVFYLACYAIAIVITKKNVVKKVYMNKDEVAVFNVCKVGRCVGNFEEFTQLISSKIANHNATP